MTNRLEDASARRDAAQRYFSELGTKPELKGYRFRTASEEWGDGFKIYGYPKDGVKVDAVFANRLGNPSDNADFFVARSELVLPGQKQYIDVAISIGKPASQGGARCASNFAG